MLLIHGTTRMRAERIIALGPDSNYREPGGHRSEESLSTYIAGSQYTFKSPEEYAQLKAMEYPDEGGPVILEMDVPEEIVLSAVDDALPLSDGYIYFFRGAGLEELQSAWPAIRQHCKIRSLS